MDEIRVWPGLSIEAEQDKVTMKLIRIHGETQEAYIQRCQQIADLALSFVPKSEPFVFNFSDTSKYKKISENAYELITPGYQPPEEKPTNQERDTHFQVDALPHEEIPARIPDLTEWPEPE